MTETEMPVALLIHQPRLAFERRSTGALRHIRIASRRSSGAARKEPLVSRTSTGSTGRVSWHTLEGALDYGFQLRQPVLLKVTTYPDGTNIATDDFSSTYGAGETGFAAIHDYQQSLAESFEILVEDRESLAPNLRNELDRLMAYVSRMTDAS